EPYNPQTTLIAAYFDSLDDMQAAVEQLNSKVDSPSALEMVDKHLLELVDTINPNQLKGVIEAPYPAAVLLIEFDESSDRAQAKLAKKALKILENYTQRVEKETDPLLQEKLWKIRHSSAAVIAHQAGTKKALPIIEDGVVPLDKFKEYITDVYELFARHRLEAAVWGHAGDANLHMQPFLDLGQVGDRQQIFRIMDEYYSLVMSLGGSTSGEHNDGRLRGPYLERLYGQQIYALFQKIKLICDPYGTMNPGVKMNVTIDDLKPILRTQFSMEHLYDHLPRS
ncbi:MAG TPA: FAD-linked oxidase C-terminal domain-containing protein, partial [Candidatus Saccharimonadales bacterium]|nr:FAD-linked oxidase C-terminal domain-containing protein [Candidatus Saccharimonadales bacterium]